MRQPVDMGVIGAARLRHQPAQALLVALLSGVLALTAVLGVAYARAVEESVQRTTLADAAVAASGVAVTTESARPPSPDELRDQLAAVLAAPTWGSPVAGASASGLLTDPERTLVPVVARDDVCEHLLLVQGTCSQRDGEVVVSRGTASAARLSVGSRLSVADSSTGQARPVAVLRDLRVVGVYAEARDTATYFFGRALSAKAPDGGDVKAGDAAFVGWSTLSSGRWRSLEVGVDVPLDVEQVTLDHLARTRKDLEALRRKASSVGASTSTQLPDLLSSAAAARVDARGPLPLLALQAVLLALVVLGYVAAATTEQRRPEVALARLRGQLPVSAAGAIVRELAAVVTAGCVVGGVAGWLLARAVAARWLATGVPVDVRWPLAVAVLASALAALVAVVLAAVPTVREPLVTLLRAVPPRSSTVRAGVADGVVVALCVAGLVTLLGDDAPSPTALVAPGLLALAGGLLLSQAFVPVAGLLGRSYLRRGRLANGLALVAVSRRPALRRLVAIETVAVALLVFAAAAGAVGAQQRTVAAQRAVGAAVVLETQPAEAPDLVSAVAAADPSGRYAAGVLVAASGSSAAARTVAVDVPRFERVALWDDSGVPGHGAPDGLASLSPPRAEPVTFAGSRLAVDAQFDWEPFTPTVAETGDSRAQLEGVIGPVRLRVDVVPPSGLVTTVDLGVLRTGRHRQSAAVPCRDGCRLRLFVLERSESDLGTAELHLRVRSVTADGAPVELRADDDGWRVASFADEAVVKAAGLGLDASERSFGESLVLHRMDQPIVLPVAATPDVITSPYSVNLENDPDFDRDDLVSGPALSGSDAGYQRTIQVPRVPGVQSPALLLPTTSVRERRSELGASTSTQVWLARDDPGDERRLVAALLDHGVQVTGRRTVTQVEEALGRQGTGLSLHLAQVVGLVALLLAAGVLAVAVGTSGRVRAYDLAGLRAVGVQASTLRRAAVREQLVVALVGALAGALLGGTGALLTLSHAPRGAALSAPDVSSGLPAMVLAAAVSVVLLLAVCLVLGARLGRQARPELLREGLR